MCQWIKGLAFVVLLTLKADALLVNTPSGPIRGTTTESFTGKEVDVYYGIPYAEPPVGDLRFRPPVEMKPWKDELDATEPPLACYQKSLPSNKTDRVEEFDDWIPKKQWSEDCLKLHIWVPKTRSSKYTVMVYIHGGGFFSGHPLTIRSVGATLAAEENIIVVSMNYRLNVQGFFYLGIPEAPGNMGLMDQQMALKWIRDNIASFRGDSDDVTIFGNSAGSASVGYQLLSHKSRDLFARAILMSGTPNAVWSFHTKEEVLDMSMKLAKSFGCTSNDKKEVLECVQSLSPDSLSDWNRENFSLMFLEFVPTVDGSFISDDPMTLLSQNDVTRTEVMIGLTAAEGSFFVGETLPGLAHSEDGGLTEKQFLSLVKSFLKKYDNFSSQLIPVFYGDWTHPEDPSAWRDAFRDLLSDYYFNCDSEDFADLYSTVTGSTVYRYVVDHYFENSNYPKWMGSSHSVDTALHLGMAAAGRKYGFTPDEVTLSRRVMRWWANFARTGNPNTLGQSGPTWEKSTPTGKEYMRISVDSSMAKHFRTQECTMVKKMVALVEENRKQCHQ